MTTSTGSDTQIGYTDTGRAVHFGFSFDGLRCVQGPPITRVVATIPPDGNRPALIAALLAVGVKPRLLCGHCFSIVVRRAYAVAYTEGV